MVPRNKAGLIDAILADPAAPVPRSSLLPPLLQAGCLIPEDTGRAGADRGEKGRIQIATRETHCH